MRKKTETDDQIIVILTRNELDQIKEFIKTTNIETETIIVKSVPTIINDFCRNDIHEEWYPKTDKILPKTPYFEDFPQDFHYARSITSSNKEDKFFKNQTIPDEYLIHYGGSRFNTNRVEKNQLESFIYEDLGFDKNHKINWDSPLVGLMLSFSRFVKIN